MDMSSKGQKLCRWWNDAPALTSEPYSIASSGQGTGYCSRCLWFTTRRQDKICTRCEALCSKCCTVYRCISPGKGSHLFSILSAACTFCQVSKLRCCCCCCCFLGQLPDGSSVKRQPGPSTLIRRNQAEPASETSFIAGRKQTGTGMVISDQHFSICCNCPCCIFW